MPGLLERQRARLCVFVALSPGSATGVDCDQPRMEDSDCCPRHTGMKWANTVDRLPDGRYTARRRLPARDLTGAIRERVA